MKGPNTPPSLAFRMSSCASGISAPTFKSTTSKSFSTANTTPSVAFPMKSRTAQISPVLLNINSMMNLTNLNALIDASGCELQEASEDDDGT
eukprot:CAMPEP_0115036290 /NCGR_PEP_ID=MMETSP0216-20121206/42029_1 /TAXON_ID=223996 /ORGANISM="Protocruzia adherens, Strain Boccale" /LENGTH=91 /DNA_ID=CAMNT_0002416079 /DNA_START=36 /DNA_END=307 /DNA_ORIENTATION=-